jgi:pilus assembly protein CpaC
VKRPSATLLLLGSVAASGGAAAQPLLAQQAPLQPPGGSALPGLSSGVVTTPIALEAGAGRLLQLPAPAATVLAADPRVARVQPASPTSLFVIGVAAGRTTVLATAEDGTAVAEYVITVRGAPTAPAPVAPAAAPPAPAGPTPPPVAAVQAALRQILRGGGNITVRGTRSSIVLTGTVPTAAEAQRAEVIARGFLGEGQQVQNELEVLSSVQVNLRVRVMEVSRDITRNLGFNWQALANTGDFVLGLRSGAAAATVASAIAGSLTNSLTPPTRLGVGVQSSRFDVNAIIDALAQDRLATILAEPNLTAQSGETASFLAGGEFPIPVAATVTGTVSIQFKQFGVSLGFVPTVLGQDRLNLRVRPEVSELSDNGAINVPLAGGTLRIPALTVRRAETTVELGSGQSFAIAGLLQRTSTQVANGVAGLGEVPVLGALFRSDNFRRAETELVIIVTPYLVKPVSDPRQLAGPTDGFRPATDLDRVLFNRQLARGTPARPVPSVPRDAGFVLE